MFLKKKKIRLCILKTGFTYVRAAVSSMGGPVRFCSPVLVLPEFSPEPDPKNAQDPFGILTAGRPPEMCETGSIERVSHSHVMRIGYGEKKNASNSHKCEPGLNKQK